jgi:hypothetical protein
MPWLLKRCAKRAARNPPALARRGCWAAARFEFLLDTSQDTYTGALFSNRVGVLVAVADVQYDKKEQLQKIEAALLEGESVEAVFDMKGGGTGFIGITSTA